MKGTKKMISALFAVLLGLMVMTADNQAFAQGGSWESKAPIPTVRWGAVGGVINGKLYVVGGWNGTESLATLEVYDPTTDTWDTKAPMPTARNGVGGGVINGKLYVVGGDIAQNHKVATLEVYDPATDTWDTKAPMPTPRSSPEAVAMNDRLYVVGGCVGWCAPVTVTLEVYDPATDTWDTKTPMPTPRGIAVGETVNGLFYVMGGCCGWVGSETELMTRTIEAYNPLTDTWTTKAQHFVGAGSAAGSINGKIYVAKSETTEAYDPGTDTWASLSPMPIARQQTASGVINGKLYVAGGHDGTQGSAALEAFTPLMSAPPAAPGQVSVVVRDREVILSWPKTPEATGHNIYWSTAPGVDRLTASKIEDAQNPYIHTNLTNGTTYYYRVTAENASGESGDSIEVSGTPRSAIPGSSPISLISPNDNQAISFTAENGRLNLIFTSVPNAEAYLTDLSLKGMLDSSTIDLHLLLFPPTNGTGGTAGFSVNGLGIASYSVPLGQETWDALALYDFSWSVNALADADDLSSIIGNSPRRNFRLQPSGSISLVSPAHHSVLTKDGGSAPQFTWNAYPGAVSYRLVLAHVGSMGFNDLLDYPGQVLNVFPMDPTAWQTLTPGVWYWTVIGMDGAGNWCTSNFTVFSFTVR